MSECSQELCPNWAGDGGCPCAVLQLRPPEPPADLDRAPDPPCGVLEHADVGGFWDDEVLGIWWCPACGEEIWATEGVDE